MDNIRKKFILYSKKYNLKEPNIMRKFHHSFRVMDFSREIAISLNLSKEDIKLAMIIGLLHDIARFEQWTKYETYIDSKSIDHGDLGHEILKDFLQEDENKEIILKAVKNHNKLKIEDGLDERTLLFCKIIRDADKLDIMKEQGLVLKEEIDDIVPEVIETFEKQKVFDNNKCSKEVDSIFRMLAFTYDIYFKYSFEYILKYDIIKNKINLLEIYCDEKDKIKYIENNLYNYINEKINM